MVKRERGKRAQEKTRVAPRQAEIYPRKMQIALQRFNPSERFKADSYTNISREREKETSAMCFGRLIFSFARDASSTFIREEREL